jgi:tRNA (guanosine-2'-O-)-methyltransferase
MPLSLYEYLSENVTAARLQRFEEVLQHRTRHITLVLENLHHSHNASACLRTCDCFGIQDVHIIESEGHFRPHPDIALGATKWLTLHRHQGVPIGPHPQHAITASCITALREQGYRILATSPRPDSVPIQQVSLDQKTAVVFGAEQPGVSDYVLETADQCVHIPMFGFTESLNVSVSAALVLHQFTQTLHASNLPWQLSVADRQELMEVWVRRTLGSRADRLIRRYEYQQSKQ